MIIYIKFCVQNILSSSPPEVSSSIPHMVKPPPPPVTVTPVISPAEEECLQGHVMHKYSYAKARVFYLRPLLF